MYGTVVIGFVEKGIGRKINEEKPKNRRVPYKPYIDS